MNIVTATVRELKDDTTVVNLATGGIFKHLWLKPMDNTGKLAVAVRLSGSWYRDYESSAEFPRVQVLVMADDTRDIADRRTKEDAEDRALAAHKAIRNVLHRPEGGCWIWGGTNGLRVVGSHQDAGPSQMNWPDSKAVVFMAPYVLKVA